MLAMVGASAALTISPIPFLGPIGGVRIGRVGGRLVLNPTYKQMEEPDLPHAKGRKVIMERETLEPLSFDAVQTLYVLGCPQGRGDQRLGLAPSKKGGSVRPGEDSGFTGDWPYFLQASTVGPAPLIQNQSPHLLFFDPLQDFLYLKLNPDRFTGEGQQGLIRDLLPPGLPGLLEGRQPPNRFACKCRDPIQQGGINRRRGERDFGPTHQIGQGLLHLDDGGNSLLAKGNGFEEAFLRNFVGPRLYHDHALFGPGDDQVQVRLLHLFVGRIQNQALGTPASMRANVAPQTEAMEDEPLLSRISETIRTVYGNSSGVGKTVRSALSANAP